MDELQQFYSKPGGCKPTKLRGSLTSGLKITKEDVTMKYNRREEHRSTKFLQGTDYCREAKEKENQLYLQAEAECSKMRAESIHGIDSLERLSSMLSVQDAGIQELTDEAMTEVYNKYSFKKEINTNFDINEFKTEILNAINSQPVVIIEGPTGCGKTTQVPQWILDECYAARRPCKIVVTQPRRIAAISIAKRVANERGWDVGGLVGYQVGLDNKTTNDTRIQYVTVGVLLQKLVASKSLGEYTHIILDEVHERGQEMDFLLLVVKKLLYTTGARVRVILMSATFNIGQFSNYFSIPTPMGAEAACCIKVIKKRPMYSVKTHYLNNLSKYVLDQGRQLKPDNEPGINPEMYDLVIKLLTAFDQIDKEEDHYDSRNEGDIPSVLVFLPGINEIESVHTYLTDRSKITAANKSKWWVLPLHSTITVDEQIRVFQRAPPGNRKVILATNIAESSITVPDIKYVIDFCLMKVLVADDETNFTSLELQWASKTNCEQRAGRAGRVRDGRVYRLVNQKFYNGFMEECRPEICRAPLERLVLLAKMLDMGAPAYILALAMDPPNLANIHRTVLALKEIGCMKKTFDEGDDEADGEVTYLGRLCAKLPLDVRVSKLIMLGHIFGCLEECITMAAAMSVKNLFSSPFQARLNTYNSRLTWADGSMCDTIAFINVYKVWTLWRKEQRFQQTPGEEYAWGRRFFVQIRSLRELDDLIKEVSRRLGREGIEVHRGPSPWARDELTIVLKIVLAGAFYPHYFVQATGDENREREALKMLSGHDPRTTVYLKDFPVDQPGELYAKSIRNYVRQLVGVEPKVFFDTNSCKVFLSFANSDADESQTVNNCNPMMPGKVLLAVYKAVKARQLNVDVRIPMLLSSESYELLKSNETRIPEIAQEYMIPKLPEIDDTCIPIKISQFVNCGNFYAQYDDAATEQELREIQMTLNKQSLLAATHTPDPGELFAAPYQDDSGTGIFRARVVKLMPKNAVWVFYIDYGSYGRVNMSSLRILPQGLCRNTHPLAMECVLAEVAPSCLLHYRATWTPEATRYFHEVIRRGRLHGMVYSVCHGVVAIELIARNGEVNVNKDLIDKGYAQAAEESYDSKVNHDIRLQASNLNMSQKRAHNRQQREQAFAAQHQRELEPPPPNKCSLNVHLKGPFSPLETTVGALMSSSRHKKVQIEWNSVNAVLLDTDPQTTYERLVVAGVVGQNEEASRLTLRHTALMPPVPGLPALLSMIFCPTMELRRDENKMRYVSTLCGLGAHEDGRPVYPEHDMLINIDVDIDLEDLSCINHIRHLMDYMMFCNEGQEAPTLDDPMTQAVPQNIRDNLMKLLMKRRKYHEPCMVPHAWDWKNEELPAEEYLVINDPHLLRYETVYPLHTPLVLRPLNQEELFALKKENDKLKEIVSRAATVSNKELACKLCGTNPMPTQVMRIHLHSKTHRDREEDFQVFVK